MWIILYKYIKLKKKIKKNLTYKNKIKYANQNMLVYKIKSFYQTFSIQIKTFLGGLGMSEVPSDLQICSQFCFNACTCRELNLLFINYLFK